MKKEVALFIGRFQPLHNGHYKFIKHLQKNMDEIIIGIGSCQASFTEKNPLTYLERKEMIERTIPEVRIEAIPDFFNLELWAKYITKMFSKVNVVYTGNNWTEEALKNTNIEIRKIKKRTNISASEVRKKILNEESIEKDVPKKVKKYLKEVNIRNRLIKIKTKISVAVDCVIEYKNKIVLIERKKNFI